MTARSSLLFALIPSRASAARAGLPDGAFDARARTMDVRAAAVARSPGGDKKDPL